MQDVRSRSIIKNLTGLTLSGQEGRGCSQGGKTIGWLPALMILILRFNLTSITRRYWLWRQQIQDGTPKLFFIHENNIKIATIKVIMETNSRLLCSGEVCSGKLLIVSLLMIALATTKSGLKLALHTIKSGNWKRFQTSAQSLDFFPCIWWFAAVHENGLLWRTLTKRKHDNPISVHSSVWHIHTSLFDCSNQICVADVTIFLCLSISVIHSPPQAVPTLGPHKAS